MALPCFGVKFFSILYGRATDGAQCRKEQSQLIYQVFPFPSPEIASQNSPPDVKH